MSHTTTARWRRALVAFGAASALILTACTGSGQGGTTSDTVDASTEITGDPVTLTLAYTDIPVTRALMAGFTAKHPNVTFKQQETSFNDYVKSIKLSMSSDDPPDIAQYNPGAMNTLVPAGLVLDLGPWAKAYGWNDKFPPASLEVLSSDKEAKQFGTGGLYAVPGALSVLGVFYNKSMLAKAGVQEPPRSLPELEAAMQKAKDAGQSPLSVGGLQVGGLHMWNALLNVIGNVDDYRAWVYGKPGSSIQTDAARTASQKMVDWAKRGFIPASASATADSDAQANFAKGGSAFLVSGNWAAVSLAKEMGDNVGFILMPTPSGAPATVASGASVAYAISSKTENPNVAAAFLDYMSSPEAAKIQFDSGFMPVDTSVDLGANGVLDETAKSFVTVADKNGIVPFPDFASPGMLDRLIPGVQGLIGGSVTVDDYLASLQKSWDEHHGT